MDNKELQEMRNRLAMLPVLKRRSDKLRSQVKEAEDEEKALLAKYREESMDVERLKAESLSVYILKTIGRYEGKLDKETEQMLAAKMEYDKAVEKLRELKRQRGETEDRLAALTQESRIYEEELEKREDYVRNNMASQASVKYREFEKEQDLLSRELAETEEALTAAERVVSTADTALGHLDSADGWATYDVWFNSGILGHIAKYDHIDNAEEAVYRLKSQLESLRSELEDINISEIVDFTGIDPTTRAVDFWFDNIFTDLSVRSRIREDGENLRMLRGRINGLISRLENKKSSIKSRIGAIESKKKELIIETQPEG